MTRNKRAKYVKITSVLASILLGTTGQLVLAQDAEEDDSSSESIEEIIVTGSYTVSDKLDTATGLGLSISETPQSVSVMTFQRMLDQNLQSLSDVVENAAGVSTKERDSSRDTFAARGFVIDNYQIDGVPMEWSSGGDAGETKTDTTLYERVEVVRGATGLLTGAGNPSASINLVRKHADSDEFVGFTRIGYGSWNTFDAMVDISSPLNKSGSVRGRFVANYEDGESWTDLLENQKTVFYGVVDVDITDQTLLRAGMSYQKNDPTASTWGGLPSWYADGSLTDWPESKTIGANWTEWASTNENQFLNVRHVFDNGWEARFDYNRFQNDADLKLLFFFGASDQQTGLGLGVFPYNSVTSRTQDAYGLHVSGDYPLFGRDHEITIGYLGMQQDYDAPTFAATTFPAVGNFNEWDGSIAEPAWGPETPSVSLDTEQSGLYAATRLHFGDRFKLILGGRQASWDEKGLNFGAPVDYGDDVFIPYAGALYDIVDNQTIYASFTEIFKPQSAYDRFGDQLDPLTGKSYEIGLKSGYFDDALQTTIAIFKVDQDNLAQPDTGFLIPGTIFEASRAAQGTTSEGFEVEIVGRPTDGLAMTFSYTNFDAKDAAGVDVSTDQPREMMKLFATYRFIDRFANLTIGGGVNWQGENYTPTVNPVTSQPQRLVQGAYTLVNLMVRYDFSNQMSVQINADNLLDEKYYSQIGFFNQLAYGAPSNASIHFRYTF